MLQEMATEVTPSLYTISSYSDNLSKASSEENLEDSLEEECCVGDSGVSEGDGGSQASEPASESSSAVSVSEEIRRFQQEINAVAVENVKFFQWKQQRVGPGGRLTGEEQLVAAPRPSLAAHQEAGEQEVVTVLGLPEEVPPSLTVRPPPNGYYNVSSQRGRQIQPSSHVAPSFLPGGETVEEGEAGVVGAGSDGEEDGEDEAEVPALPSVKLLTTRFQALSTERARAAARQVRVD